MRRPISFIFLFFAAAPLWAAPDTTSRSWSGSLTKGTTVTFDGSSYGSTIPTVVLHDDYENGIEGSSMTFGTQASYVGNWSTPSISGLGPVYTTQAAFSGTKSQVTDFTSNPASNGGEFYNQVFLSSATKWMACYDWAILGDWPGYCGTGANMKFLWWMFGNSTTNTDIYRGFGVSGCTIPVGTLFDGNDTASFTKNFTTNITTTTNATLTAADWKQSCEFIDGLNQGDIRFWDRSSTGTFRLAYSTTNLAVPFLMDPDNQSGHIDRVHMPGFGRLMPGTSWFFDNVYIASGAASWATIWMINQPRMTDSTVRVMVKPVAWADTQVQGMIPTHPFSNGDTVYFTICDSNLVCDDSGISAIIGATQGSSLPTGLNGGFNTQGSFTIRR